MQLSTITSQIPFIGRKKRQEGEFWDLAQDQTRFLYNVAYKYAGNRYDAEDLVQETLHTAYKNFHQLRDSRKFRSWMFAILRNHFLKWQRKKAPGKIDEFEDGIEYLTQLETASMRPDTAIAYEKKIEAEAVQSILNKLPEKYKSVLILYYMEESKYQEIANMLSVPVGTVMSRLSRANQAMKKALLRSTVSQPRTTKVVRLNSKR